jgi:hypothetical protein
MEPGFSVPGSMCKTVRGADTKKEREGQCLVLYRYNGQLQRREKRWII